MAFISIGGLAEGGVIPDHPATDLPPNVFNEAFDIEYTPEGIRPAVKEVEIFPTMQTNPLHLTKVKLGAGIEGWVYLDEKTARIIYNDTHTDITRIAGDGGEYSALETQGWQVAILHGVPIFSNSRDIPQALDPGNPLLPMTNLANWPTSLRTEILRPYKVFLIAMKFQDTGGPYDQQSLIWSAPADPGQVPPSWDFTDPATQAGLYTFSETDDRLVDGLALGDEFIIYKERSIHAMRFIGGTFIMSIKPRPGDIGLLSSGCVVAIPQGHFFVSGDDLYIYAGNGLPKSIATARVRREIFATITFGEKDKVFVEHDASRKSVWVFYPTDGNIWCNRAAIWNYETNTWTFRNTPNVSSAAFGDVNRIIQTTWDELTSDWDSDNSSWFADTTIWGADVTWDSQEAVDVWDSTIFLPVVENLIMVSRLRTPSIYDPVSNTSSADGISWAGDSEFPPLWLVPSFGVRLLGSLIKRGLAIVGRDQRGALEVNRTIQKILTEFYPEVEFGVVEIRFGTHDTPKADIEWDEFLRFDAAVDQKLDPFISGRYLAFEIKGAGEGEGDWLISGYGMEVSKGGRY